MFRCRNSDADRDFVCTLPEGACGMEDFDATGVKLATESNAIQVKKGR
jgi:hypothetical protein